MITRFDSLVWISARGEALSINEMETDHLMNTLKMFVQKPTVVVSMLIRDIESTPQRNCCTPWTKEGTAYAIPQSIHNVTSMTSEELRTYAVNSRLGCAMKAELVKRGVNVDSYLALLDSVN